MRLSSGRGYDPEFGLCEIYFCYATASLMSCGINHSSPHHEYGADDGGEYSKTTLAGCGGEFELAEIEVFGV